MPRHRRDKGALQAALAQLAEQDPLINLRQDDVRQELYVSLYGEVQKEVIRDTLSAAFGIAVEFRETTTICIERPIGTGAAVEVMREAPNPFLATVGLRVDPAPLGSGVRFALEVELGSIRLAFHKAVEDTVAATLQQGLYGWNVTDCVVTMTHSGYAPRQSHSHARFDKSMSSTGADFRHLTPLVLMNALKRAGTQVCEPVQQFRIEFPTDVLGAVSRALAQLDAIPLTTQTSDSTARSKARFRRRGYTRSSSSCRRCRAAKAYSNAVSPAIGRCAARRRRAPAPITIRSTAKRICWPSCAACKPGQTVADGLAVRARRRCTKLTTSPTVQAMFIVFDAERPSDSPYIERIWRCHSERAGTFLSVASSHWELVVTRLDGGHRRHAARTGNARARSRVPCRRRVVRDPLQGRHVHAAAAGGAVARRKRRRPAATVGSFVLAERVGLGNSRFRKRRDVRRAARERRRDPARRRGRGGAAWRIRRRCRVVPRSGIFCTRPA